jgi:Rrf2 family transcriptional regulator, iron-sulfur cluster assembly transcription factor
MRLELTRRTDLALLAIRFLHAAQRRVKRTELGEAIGTSPDFLAQVMGLLVRAGWVDSGPGRSGGYLLAVDPGSISVLDLIAAVERVPDPSRCVLRAGACDPDARCAVHDAWSGARTALLDELKRTPVVVTSS